MCSEDPGASRILSFHSACSPLGCGVPPSGTHMGLPQRRASPTSTIFHENFAVALVVAVVAFGVQLHHRPMGISASLTMHRWRGAAAAGAQGAQFIGACPYSRALLYELRVSVPVASQQLHRPARRMVYYTVATSVRMARQASGCAGVFFACILGRSTRRAKEEAQTQAQAQQGREQGEGRPGRAWQGQRGRPGSVCLVRCSRLGHQERAARAASARAGQQSVCML